MYHLIKPITEWRHHDCEPKPGARFVDDSSGGPMFDIHDVRPMSQMADDYLIRLHSTLREDEYRQRNPVRFRPNSVYANWDICDNLIQPTRKKKMSKMSHNRMMAEALLDNFNTVDVVRGGAIYTYKVPKGMELEEGDWVVVPVPNAGFNALKVNEVHGRAKNPDELELKWVVCKADMSDYKALIEQDEKAMETVLELEKRKTKRELLNELTSDLSSDEMLTLQDDLGIEQPVQAISKD